LWIKVVELTQKQKHQKHIVIPNPDAE